MSTFLIVSIFTLFSLRYNFYIFVIILAHTIQTLQFCIIVRAIIAILFLFTFALLLLFLRYDLGDGAFLFAAIIARRHFTICCRVFSLNIFGLVRCSRFDGLLALLTQIAVIIASFFI